MQLPIKDRSPIEKEWVIAPKVPNDVILDLNEYSPIMQQLLYNRGITNPTAAAHFFQIEANSHNPFLLKGIQNAVERIINAIQIQEKIAVFGDYDADGITATALLTEVLSVLGAKVMPYIPEREEGYGVNTNAIDYLHESGVSLVITVDCGIRSPNELKYAQSLGMTVIITDHHVPGDVIPAVYSVICPRVEGDEYPEKNLSGVGLAYKLAQALFLSIEGSSEKAEDWLDLAAIGTVADVVPLLGENRLIVTKGLKNIRFTHRLGLLSLIKIAGLNEKKINTFDISFGIAPRLNAAGRLDSPIKALELLMTSDPVKAGLLVQELDDINRRRQKETIDMQEFAQSTIDENRMIIVAMHKDFNSGLVGLVSAKLTDFYYRPSIVGHMGKEYTRASCRSIPEFHITHALDQCDDLLIRHGGHAMAAGFTIANDKIEYLLDRLEKIAQLRLSIKDLQPKINVDMEYPLHLLPKNILNDLEKLEPLGAENSEAVFVSRGVLVKHARTVGKDENHLKMVLRDNGIEYDAIAFNQGYWGKVMPPRIDLTYSIERNFYNGNIYTQLRVKDIKSSQ